MLVGEVLTADLPHRPIGIAFRVNFTKAVEEHCCRRGGGIDPLPILTERNRLGLRLPAVDVADDPQALATEANRTCRAANGLADLNILQPAIEKPAAVPVFLWGVSFVFIFSCHSHSRRSLT